MRYTVRCVTFGLFQVIDTERDGLVVATWRTMAGAIAYAQFRNGEGS